MTEGQSLYVIADGVGHMKLGIGVNPRRRLRQLQTGNAHRLALRRSVPFAGNDPEQVERYAHWILRERHVGGEWFSIDETEALAALLAAGIAVIKGLRAPRPGFGGVGRKKQWTERLTLPLTKDTVDAMDAALGPDEVRLDLIRDAIERELERRKRLAKRAPLST